jgi:hypothetical protein
MGRNGEAKGSNMVSEQFIGQTSLERRTIESGQFNLVAVLPPAEALNIVKAFSP